MDSKIELTVIMPALNEEENIQAAVSNTLRAFKDFDINGEVVFINDGSTDNTAELVNDIIKNGSPVRIIKHDIPKGIGASFWDGVSNANGDVVVMLPGDNENDPWEIFRYYKLLDHVDIVIPFIFNKEVRSLFRNILSCIYRFIINTTFLVNFNYTNGTILYRKSLLEELNCRSSGFFFQTDILVRTVKKGYLFAEVPYRLMIREHGASRAISFPSLLQVMRGYIRLVKDIYFRGGGRKNKIFSRYSLTAERKTG